MPGLIWLLERGIQAVRFESVDIAVGLLLYLLGGCCAVLSYNVTVRKQGQKTYVQFRDGVC